MFRLTLYSFHCTFLLILIFSSLYYFTHTLFQFIVPFYSYFFSVHCTFLLILCFSSLYLFTLTYFHFIVPFYSHKLCSASSKIHKHWLSLYHFTFTRFYFIVPSYFYFISFHYSFLLLLIFISVFHFTFTLFLFIIPFYFYSVSVHYSFLLFSFHCAYLLSSVALSNSLYNRHCIVTQFLLRWCSCSSLSLSLFNS